MTAMTRVANALDAALAACRDEHRLALMMYLTAGFPDRASTRRWGPLLAQNGASILELGVPFSDPLGDGPTIQRSSQLALEGGMSLRGALSLADEMKSESAVPIVLMSYCNPLFKMGEVAFAEAASAAGVTGVIVPDLPVEEAGELSEALAARNLHTIFLLSPASTEERIRRTAAVASGFIYCMSLTGVTGARDAMATDLGTYLGRIRSYTDLPLVVGFGVSTPSHLRALQPIADGAIVASALVDLVERTPVDQRDEAIASFVKELAVSCSGS